MAIWFQIGIALNVVCWAVFFYLLTRRRWTVAALAVGLFHMLFAALNSVAPIRSLLDPDYVGYGLGVLQFEKRAVALPAALVFAWALASAWVTVGKGRGRWMRLVMIGDLLFASSMAVAIALDRTDNWKFQLGENFTAEGVPGLLIIVCLLTLPFVVCAAWAARRAQTGGTASPPAPQTNDERDGAERDRGNSNHLRYSAIRA